MQLQISLCLPREADTVALARSSIADMLVSLGVDDGCVDDIRLAVSEACSNVVQHTSTDDEYEVTLKVDRSLCVITVANVGNGFDADGLVGVMPAGDSARGRGVAIMRAIMDSVEFSSEPESGTLVRLVREVTAKVGSPLARLGERAEGSSSQS